MKRRVREEDEVGELNIVPYLDIVTNLVMFMLLSLVGLISLGVLDVGTPKLGEPDPVQANPDQKPEDNLVLTVGVSDRGFYVAGAGGVLEGQQKDDAMDMTREPTVPKRGGLYDYAGLSRLMSDIKKEPKLKGDRVILVADMNIPYETIIGTMDACRERKVQNAAGQIEQQKLFSEIWLSTMQ